MKFQLYYLDKGKVSALQLKVFIDIRKFMHILIT